jgi:tetratricopeptide (TPR) repeat protein
VLLDWFNARQAAAVGTALAEDLLSPAASASPGGRGHGPGTPHRLLNGQLQKFLQRVDREARPLHLNVFKKAKLANSFKWRLLEKGVEREVVDELTEALVRRLSSQAASAKTRSDNRAVTSTRRAIARNAHALLAKGNEYMSRGAAAEAIQCYRELLSLDPRHAIAHNNLGAALLRLGHYSQAEAHLRNAIGIRWGYADAHGNLGTLLRLRGHIAESEMRLRRALKLRPAFVEAQVSLGDTLMLLGRLRDARDVLEKAIKVAPRNVEALVVLGRIAGLEGRVTEADATLRRALEIEPKSTSAWAALVRMRRMTSADRTWLAGAEAAAANGPAAPDEANIRYAIGKYCDDVGDFRRAFRSYERANELQKAAAEPYDPAARSRFVDDLIRVCTSETLARAHAGASDSERPVLVVGMPRSGTSLVEQIIASHPHASGAGELAFWSDAVHKHDAALHPELPGESRTRQLAAAYLRTLGAHSADAVRVVDKATVNSDYLGIIHAVFPRARMIYLRRDPIDSCLSCYFQPFSPELNYTMDLADLAHYYREHQRLVAHWRSVLPAQTLLEVPYAQLVADQEGWTRRILDFLGLQWDARCLDFHLTDRTVLTASSYQVRQRLYQGSIGRWRNYRKFIGPLLSLHE